MPLDLSKPIQLRDGTPAHFIGKRLSGSLVIEVECEIVYRNHDGSETHRGESSNDLINVPEKIVRWANIYECQWRATFHDSRGEANRQQESGRIACIRIEFTRGQFDE